MLYLFYRTRRHFIKLEREIITFAKMMINSKLGYFPFPIFICVYRVTSKPMQHMENCGLML